MQLNDLTHADLRRLAETKTDGPTVLSLYLDLDPRSFGTGPARASAIRSLLDATERAVHDVDGLSHDEGQALRQSLERVEGYFRDDFSADGAHGLAIFASEPQGLFEVVRLPRPIASGVVISDAPQIEPLTRVEERECWALVLVSRADGRLLRGSSRRLVEIADLDEYVHGQHDQGGLSQSRYQRRVDQQAARHIQRVLTALERSDRETPFDRLLVAAPDEDFPFVEHHLPPHVRSRFAGRINVDVGVATPDDVLAAALPVMLEDARRRERALLDRLADALGMDGRASASLPKVLDALVQRRVETLLLDDGFSAPGLTCPTCGWLGTTADGCPIDGASVEAVDDITERAVEVALMQSADVVFVREHDDLGPLGGIAALQRY